MFALSQKQSEQRPAIRDEYDCYTTVQQQTGINPDAGAPSGPSAAEVQAAEQQAAATRRKRRVDERAEPLKVPPEEPSSGRLRATPERVRLLARRLVRCAVDDSSAKRTRRQKNRRLSRRARRCSSKPIKPKPHTIKQMDTFKRGFSACMDARVIRSDSSSDGSKIVIAL